MSKVRKMLEMAEVGPGDLVYDLGCGDGRTIITAARRYGAQAVGIAAVGARVVNVVEGAGEQLPPEVRWL